MVLLDISKILIQIELIGITGNSEVDTYLVELRSYYVEVEADVRSTVSALQQNIAMKCTQVTSPSRSSTSFTSDLTDGTKISSESTFIFFSKTSSEKATKCENNNNRFDITFVLSSSSIGTCPILNTYLF